MARSVAVAAAMLGLSAVAWAGCAGQRLGITSRGESRDPTSPVPEPEAAPPMPDPLTPGRLSWWIEACVQRSDEALGHVEAGMSTARERRDSALLRCLGEQRDALDRTRAALEELASEPADRDEVRAVARRAERRCHEVVQLQSDAAHCVGETSAGAVGGDIVHSRFDERWND